MSNNPSFTQRFLNLFFKGKWHNYGHVSMCLIVALVCDVSGIVWWLSAIIAMGFGALIEFIQWIRPHDTGFNLRDLLVWDLIGVKLYLLLKLFLFIFI